MGRKGTPGPRERWLAKLTADDRIPDSRAGSEVLLAAYAFAAASTVKGERALMSIPMLQRRTRLSRRRAQGTRDELLELGWLEVQHRGYGNRYGKGKATVYRLATSTMQERAPVHPERAPTSTTSTAASAEVGDVETPTASSAEVVPISGSNIDHFSSNVDHSERKTGRPSSSSDFVRRNSPELRDKVDTLPPTLAVPPLRSGLGEVGVPICQHSVPPWESTCMECNANRANPNQQEQ